MATQLLRAPEKGTKQQSLVDDQQLELRTQMAAHYLQTDHDTDGGRLIQGQVDHTLLVGHRVRTSTEELEKLRAEFGTDQLQLEKCPVCQRCDRDATANLGWITSCSTSRATRSGKRGRCGDAAHLVRALCQGSR